MSTIFCDTDCELWYTTAKELNLEVIQMPYTIDGEEKLYDLGENTDCDEFFIKMKNGAKAITSGLNEETYIEIFEPAFKKGEDILYIAFSSKMSSTFKYLELAIDKLTKQYPDVKYRQFDTLNISMGAGLMVYMAAQFCKEHGGDIDATWDYLESIIQHIGTYFVVDDMKYLARGGRISPAKAKLGNLMQIKPVLSISKSGEIDVYAKQNGIKKAHRFMLDVFDQKYENIDDAPVVIVSALCPDYANEFVTKLKEKHPEIKTVWHQPVGPVIGAHCGPGTIGLIFTSKER